MMRQALFLLAFPLLLCNLSFGQTPVCNQSVLYFYDDNRGNITERSLYTCKNDGNETPTEIIKLGVFPNPTSDYLNIGLLQEASDTLDVPLSIYTNDLRFVDRFVLTATEQRHQIDVSSYSPGIYFIVPENKEYHNTLKASFIVLK